MRLNLLSLGSIALLLAATGCSKPTPKVPGPEGVAKPGDTSVVTEENKKAYDDALKAFVEHDKANDWAEASCKSSADAFTKVNDDNKKKAGKELPQALYNAGLSFQRCNNDAEAKKLFAQTLALDPKFHRAKVQVALYDYKDKGESALPQTVEALQQAVLDAEFQNPDALVNLAMLQMKRNGSTGDGKSCENDMDCAKRNIQRALAVDDSFMPAFNQLALYYLERAKAKAGKTTAKTVTAGKKTKGINQQQLELAALVCSQAIRKNPKYAPIHNTAGLIQVELGNINGAVAEFRQASQLDASFFEAHMNYAAVNLSFRGFKNAEEAYAAALKIKPGDFDAKLGQALAIRGQINDTNFDESIKRSQALLDEAKKIAPERPETYYNEAILTQEYKVKGIMDQKATLPVYDQAIATYNVFIQKAGGGAEYADAVKRSKERIKDMEDFKKFILEGIKADEEAAAAKPPEQLDGLDGPTGGTDGAAPAPAPDAKPAQ
jgi:Tfp pilus assembly protein PilF